MTLDYEKIIEDMKQAIRCAKLLTDVGHELCQAHESIAGSEILAKAALSALQDNMEDPYIKADKEAERLYIKCREDNPDAGTLPSIFHFQQQTRPSVSFQGLWTELKNLGR